MKKNFLNFVLFAIVASFFVSCSKDDSVTIPKVTLNADVMTIAEDATSALQIRVVADKPLGTAYSVKMNISGTAVAGVNYQEIPNTISIPANATSAIISVMPINASAIEGNKTISIELIAGEAYNLAMEASLEVNIIDNANPVLDAPEVAFETANIVTNPYMEEVKTISVSLSNIYSSDLTIPLNITGDLLADTDYEITGLTNGAIIIPAGEISADFTVAMKNTAVVNMNKTMNLGFATPTVTDYLVKATDNTRTINAVDPQVDFGSWFNEENRHKTLIESKATMPAIYIQNADAFLMKRSFFDKTDTEEFPEGDWNLLGREHYMHVSPNNSNQWAEVINIYKMSLGDFGVDIAEQERYQVQANDYLGLARFFRDQAPYGSTTIKSEKGWFRFVSTDASATEGIVVIPEQTLIIYKLKEDSDWKSRITVELESGREIYYPWYADSRSTQGDISQSTNTVPVSIQVAKSVGTYNLETNEIQVDVTFTCDDASLSIEPKYIHEQDGDTYTLRLKYTCRHESE